MTTPNPDWLRSRKKRRKLSRKLKQQGFTPKEFTEWLERNKRNDPVSIPGHPWGFWSRFPEVNEQLIEPSAKRFGFVRCKIPPNGTRPEK